MFVEADLYFNCLVGLFEVALFDHSGKFWFYVVRQWEMILQCVKFVCEILCFFISSYYFRRLHRPS